MASTQTQEHQEEYSLLYGEEAISYCVMRKEVAAGKKRKINIKVHPNLDVVVNAPSDARADEIHQAVLKRVKWISDALADFKAQFAYVEPKSYVSGEMQFYLGRRYMLKVIENPEKLTCVKLERGKLFVSLTRFNQDKAALTKALVKGWYEVRAEKMFRNRLIELLPKTPWVEGIPSFRIMPMQKQWGSCSAKGSLMLNPHLVKASKECIDYVILHELCHIAEHNHSDKFWRLLTSVMPNWFEVKNRLDSMAELYLNE